MLIFCEAICCHLDVTLIKPFFFVKSNKFIVFVADDSLFPSKLPFSQSLADADVTSSATTRTNQLKSTGNKTLDVKPRSVIEMYLTFTVFLTIFPEAAHSVHSAFASDAQQLFAEVPEKRSIADDALRNRNSIVVSGIDVDTTSDEQLVATLIDLVRMRHSDVIYTIFC